MRQAGVVSYLHGDHLNSASLATNVGGGLVSNSTTRYYPYGGTRVAGSGLPTEYRFTGQRREAGLGGPDGLYFYNARWYDPSLGRFLSADTIVPSPGNPQDLNRYSYTRGNPLRLTDPTGHYAFEEDPDDPVSFGTNVRSKHDYTHPNYRTGNQSDAQFLAGATAPAWVPVLAIFGAEEVGELAQIAHWGIKGLVNLVIGGACADRDCTNEASTLYQRVQSLLQGKPGYNVSPEARFGKHSTIGKEFTFITDKKAIADVIGDFETGNIGSVTTGQAANLEQALGLPTGSLADGFRISRIEGILGRSPASPLTGNPFFLGPGRGLPGGGPELMVNPPISTQGGPGIMQFIMKVLGQ